MDDAFKDVAKIGNDELRILAPVVTMAVTGVEAPSHCELFSEFGVAVQLVMAVLAFSSLLYKRHQEFPQRPLKIWFLDTSKQGIGNMVAHGFNAGLAVVFGSQGSGNDNACAWYLINIVLDTTLGIAASYVIMGGLEKLQERFQWSALDSGYYGHPPSWKTWFKQVLVWLSVVFLAKLVVTAFVFLGEDRLAIIGQLLMYPFRNHPKLELLVVMLLFPFALNVVAFWLFDNLLKKSVNKATAYWITYESLKPVHRERVFML